MSRGLFTRLFILLLIAMIHHNITFAQQKRLTDTEYISWKDIKNVQLSADGTWTLYSVQPNKGDATLKVRHNPTGNEMSFDRANNARLDYDGTWVYFLRTCHADTLTALKKAGTKNKDLPQDTLVIVNLATREVDQTPHVLQYKTPRKTGNTIAYLLEPQTWDKKDSTKTELKKETKENGSRLVIRNLKTQKSDTIYYVNKYQLADESPILLAHSTGSSDSLQSIIRYDMSDMTRDSLWIHKGKYEQMNMNKSGDKIAFIADLDTSDALIRPHELYFWQKGKKTVKIADAASKFLSKEQKISEHQVPYFSEDNRRLFYGISPHPIIQDTSLLDEEIVEVEVWSTTDSKLFTQQNVNLKEDKERSYLVSYDIAYDQHISLHNESIPQLSINTESSGDFAVAAHTKSYEKESTWLGYTHKDLYKIDINTGTTTPIIKKTEGRIRMSPQGKYAYWYSRPDTIWYVYDLYQDKLSILTQGEALKMYDEQFDQPNHPYAYGSAGWTADDHSIILYDRYDLWEFPMNGDKAKKWTNGRNDKIVYRYLGLDDDLKYIPSDSSILLSLFDEKDKSSGYAMYQPSSNALRTLIKGPYHYSTKPVKARNADSIVTTKESFKVFPDLLLTDLSMAKFTKISNANPQQNDYAWGSAELFNWTDFKGNNVEGLLIKPDNFDPKKKYPLMVNFYERNSDGLYRHRAPDPHRSTINYTMYANKGYVIFNPDIHYTDGHPGESCYNAVISGVEALQKEGYVDAQRMGIQGHSWGGYQIAYLLNKTNIFKCAEAGAPVVNMTSAYGGIRWRSGMSRQFQYEHTQSRIGATLWEKPELYIDNSPLFDLPKMNTPVLILHNDKDGAVPWYQGIEYFVALRRLGKLAWMLNYNGEPHWPQKWQNRMDFQKRMSQFFDHYLLDLPMPVWMAQGMTAQEKGIHQGLELIMDK